MTFVIVTGTEEVVEKLTGMRDRISHFANVDMANEFAAWQREDLHRKHAAVKKSTWWNHKRSASTTIRPHSRYEMARSKAYQQGLRRRMGRRKNKTTAVPGQIHRSTRPILREAIEKLFFSRLTAVFYEKIKW